ncbi:hypothetical protein RMB13_02030 [Acinetobacter sp. V102_4]|uniref:hypothetical protein n=1 Tax=Acinetobacter sp. V102_4 TaxID=3072984 RepID=UPI00287EB909|nr:hypothetical protein [Acinetobacter sp. V102_4]MDS7928273.1 hypothetical protein [Acinetobacter sp. V102_4]
MRQYLIVVLLSLGLVACNSSNEDQEQKDTPSKVELAPSLDIGTYTVSIETDQELPMTGKYYSGIDGNKLLVFNDEQDRASIIITYDAKNQMWYTNQADKVTTIKHFDHVEEITGQKVNIASLSGTYTLSLANDVTIPLEINSQGQMASQDANCIFTGVITGNLLVNTASYHLQNNKCDAMKNNTKGYLIVDEDYGPASFRLISDMTNSQDAWAFSSKS